MTCFILPIERFDEMDGLYAMSDFEKKKRYENLVTKNEICIVAEQDGKIIGEITIMTNNANIPAAVIPNRRVYFFGLRVHPDFRRKGVAKSLLAYAIKTTSSRGIFEITIAVEKGNELAKEIYTKSGFEPFLNDCTEDFDGKKLSFDLMMLVL